MNNRPNGKSRLNALFFACLFFLGIAQSRAVETNGLFYVSGQKADLKILQARVYSQDNDNRDFEVDLDTSYFKADPKSQSMPAINLCVNGCDYACTGWGHGQSENSLSFKVKGQDQAGVVAKYLSVPCHLRAPPGYKLSCQFLPSKASFSTNEPVIVKLEIKNQDDKTVLFQRGGMERGLRDDQYYFQAMRNDDVFGLCSVPDVGSHACFGGLFYLVPLEPGDVFDDQIDLKKWFALDKAGTYYIQGFYLMQFYQDQLPPQRTESVPWNQIWSDYASAEFTVIVK